MLTSSWFIIDQQTGMASIDGVWGDRVSVRIRLRSTFAIEPGCTFPFSLISYESQGPSWATSGTQSFIDHTAVVLGEGNRTAVLEVRGPECFGMADLYQGTTVYDGGTGAGHGPVPDYATGTRIPGLVRAWDGGNACVEPEPPAEPPAESPAEPEPPAVEEPPAEPAIEPEPPAEPELPAEPVADPELATGHVVELEVASCTDGAKAAAVTLHIGDGSGTREFAVWARAGGAAYTRIGRAVTLPAADAGRTATVAVPLVEDQPLTIEVRVDGAVVRTFEPVTANCVDATDPVPTALVGNAHCVDDDVAEMALALDNSPSRREAHFEVTTSTREHTEILATTVPAGATDTSRLRVQAGVATTVVVEADGATLVDEIVLARCAEVTSPGPDGDGTGDLGSKHLGAEAPGGGGKAVGTRADAGTGAADQSGGPGTDAGTGPAPTGSAPTGSAPTDSDTAVLGTRASGRAIGTSQAWRPGPRATGGGGAAGLVAISLGMAAAGGATLIRAELRRRTATR